MLVPRLDVKYDVGYPGRIVKPVLNVSCRPFLLFVLLTSFGFQSEFLSVSMCQRDVCEGVSRT